MSRRILGIRISVSFLALLNVCVCVADSVGGPFAVIPETVEPCPEGSTDVPFSIAIKVIKDIQNPPDSFIFSNHTSHFVFDDEKDASLNFSLWNKNTWKENFLHMKFKKLCTSLRRYVPHIWADVLSKLSGPSSGSCPMKEGTYYINNVSTALLKPENVPYMFYGRWRVDGKVFDPRAKKTVACTRFFVRIVRKKK